MPEVNLGFALITMLDYISSTNRKPEDLDIFSVAEYFGRHASLLSLSHSLTYKRSLLLTLKSFLL